MAERDRGLIKIQNGLLKYQLAVISALGLVAWVAAFFVG